MREFFGFIGEEQLSRDAYRYLGDARDTEVRAMSVEKADAVASMMEKFLPYVDAPVGVLAARRSAAVAG